MYAQSEQNHIHVYGLCDLPRQERPALVSKTKYFVHLSYVESLGSNSSSKRVKKDRFKLKEGSKSKSLNHYMHTVPACTIGIFNSQFLILFDCIIL